MLRSIASVFLLAFVSKGGLASPVSCETSTAMSIVMETIPSSGISSRNSFALASANSFSLPNNAVTSYTCACTVYVTSGISSNGSTAAAPIPTIAPFSNTTSVSNGTFVFPNATLTISIPPAGPEPTPNPPSNTAAAQLLRTVRDKVLLDYTAYGTISCFQAGSTLDCGGPWLYGPDWNNNTLLRNLQESTITKPSSQCSSDSTYLQPSSLDRVFYGFTANNITDSLAGVAHATSVYAAGICSLNQTCAQLYNNATEQMYADFQFYLNSTFFAYMQSILPQNDSLVFCPATIKSTASLLNSATSYFDGGKEYFGIHNSAFLPGVAQAINGTVQEARLELGLMLANNAHMFEGVWLNMIFFSYDIADPLTTRSIDGEDIYPGCSRRKYVKDGPCPGVLPPREYDMAGTVLPMKYRDMMERFGNDSSIPTSTSLAIRQDAGCAAAIAAIQSKQANLKTARLVLDGAVALVGDVPFAEAEILALDPPLAIFAATLGITAFALLVAIAACDKFNTCNGLPPELVSIGNIFLKAAASTKASDIIDKVVDKGIDEFESVVEDNVPEAKLVGSLLDGVSNYYDLAAACCSVNCDSAICQQASVGCSLTWGDFWSGGLLNCGMV